MKTKEQLISEFEEFIVFAESLSELTERQWTAPIAAGKWSVRDIISHITLWDQYFYEEAIARITQNLPLTLKHLNFDEFNKNAMKYAATRTMDELLMEAVQYRKGLIHHLHLIPEEDYLLEHTDGDGNKFTVYSYIEDFVPHDRGHISQIKAFLGAGYVA